jgi:hypothetical protein
VVVESELKTISDTSFVSGSINKTRSGSFTNSSSFTSGNLINDIVGKLRSYGIGNLVADSWLWALRRGLNRRIRKTLANCPFLGRGQLGFSGRPLGGGEADSADNHNSDSACADKSAHDGLLISLTGFRPVARLMRWSRRANWWAMLT